MAEDSSYSEEIQALLDELAKSDESAAKAVVGKLLKHSYRRLNRLAHFMLAD